MPNVLVGSSRHSLSLSLLFPLSLSLVLSLFLFLSLTLFLFLSLSISSFRSLSFSLFPSLPFALSHSFSLSSFSFLPPPLFLIFSYPFSICCHCNNDMYDSKSFYINGLKMYPPEKFMRLDLKIFVDNFQQKKFPKRPKKVNLIFSLEQIQQIFYLPNLNKLTCQKYNKIIE